MRSLIVFIRISLNNILPKNRMGDKIYAFINFVFIHRRFPTNKMIFNDVIYRLKISDEILDPLRIFVTDKEYAKIYTKSLVGEEFTVPTFKIFQKYEELIDYNFPSECCIKPTHLSGEFILKVQDTKINYEKIKKWFSMNYYYRSREANYKSLKPKVIVEALVFNESNIRDYRFWCYKGKVKLIMVDCEPKNKLQIKKRTFFNLNWNEQDYNLKYNREDVPKPSNLKQMISVAEKICSNFDFIRVDIFTDGTKCLLGEITNIHANASQRFIPLSGEKTASETIFS